MHCFMLTAFVGNQGPAMLLLEMKCLFLSLKLYTLLHTDEINLRTRTFFSTNLHLRKRPLKCSSNAQVSKMTTVQTLSNANANFCHILTL